MYYSLLKTWCDKLLELQITDHTTPTLRGGILCPSCGRIHGRYGDAIYPLLYLANATKNTLYIHRAKALFDWVEYNMSRPDGSYINDTNSTWNGITVFSAIQLGEALHYYGHLLDKTTYTLWENRLRLSVEFLYHTIDSLKTNINYPVTCSAAMAIAGRHFKEERFHIKAKELANRAVAKINEEGLLEGEGPQPDRITGKKEVAVDLGYNVEESLPALALYATLEEDQEVLEIVQKSMEAHLAFMLPDGGWDNSWGSRSNKWTYWGSRTSDGAQLGYGLLSQKNPAFAEAVYRNTALMAACTHGGLLHGGPMYHSSGEPPCVHHTFCHAKALASLLEAGIAPAGGGASLPRDNSKGITSFSTIDTHLLSKGGWRATVTASPYDYVIEGHATGGSLTMLWHTEVGPICVGTMTNYQLIEPNNMQIPQIWQEIAHTPRIEYADSSGNYFRSCNDKTAELTLEDTGNAISVQAKGTLRTGEQTGQAPYRLQYQLEDGFFTITATTWQEDAVLVLPVISAHNEAILSPSDTVRVVMRKDHKLTLKSSAPMERKEFPALHLNSSSRRFSAETFTRVFNPVGGFQAIPFQFQLTPGIPLTVTIAIPT